MRWSVTTRNRLHAPLMLAAMLCIAALAYAGRNVVQAPLSAFAAQDTGQRLLFVLRVGLLLSASWACAERGAYRTLGLVLAAFVASLAVRGLVFALVAAALYALVDARRWSAPAILGACLLSWFVLPRPGGAPALPSTPAALVAHYRAAGNLWRARYAALGWARDEKNRPGAGTLTLAKIDRHLGERREAARALAAVLAHAPDPTIRARARALALRWRREDSSR